MGIWKADEDRVDTVLREARAMPREQFVASLSNRMVIAPPAVSPRSHGGSRVAFALALTVFMLGTFASFGGLGYAATTAKQSSATAQYGEENVPNASTTSKPKPPPTVQVAGTSTGAPSKDTLPFTGYGLGGTALIGSLLLALGVFLRRREGRE